MVRQLLRIIQRDGARSGGEDSGGGGGGCGSCIPVERNFGDVPVPAATITEERSPAQLGQRLRDRD